MKILLTRGLPASGKTTFSRELLNREPGKWKRINKDDLRSLLDDGKWSKKNEEFIIQIRNSIAKQALHSGYSIIVDDTNFSVDHVNYFKEIAEYNEYDFEIKDFTDVPLRTCIERDLKRLNSVGKDVIVGMYNKYLKPPREVYEYTDGLPKAIIVDIDNTLAIMGERSPYSWSEVGIDSVNEVVKNFINERGAGNGLGVKALIVSGRDGACRIQTEKWLKDNNVFYDKLFMRQEGNNEKDTIIKERIFEEEIKGKYNVLYVLDDRLGVCRMWHQKGLQLLRVGDPDADF